MRFSTAHLHDLNIETIIEHNSFANRGQLTEVSYLEQHVGIAGHRQGSCNGLGGTRGRCVQSDAPLNMLQPAIMLTQTRPEDEHASAARQAFGPDSDARSWRWNRRAAGAPPPAWVTL